VSSSLSSNASKDSDTTAIAVGTAVGSIVLVMIVVQISRFNSDKHLTARVVWKLWFATLRQYDSGIVFSSAIGVCDLSPEIEEDLGDQNS
jgi:hypothetical protein